jgi:hypothetical protein
MAGSRPISLSIPKNRVCAIDELARNQLWKLLWLPANLPYYEARGAFACTEDNPHTEQLIFSSSYRDPSAC